MRARRKSSINNKIKKQLRVTSRSNVQKRKFKRKNDQQWNYSTGKFHINYKLIGQRIQMRRTLIASQIIQHQNLSNSFSSKYTTKINHSSQ